MVDEEHAANYDAKYGEGSWQRYLNSVAEWEANRPKREAEALAQIEKEKAERAAETPAQKKKREAKEAAQERKNERYWDAQYRKENDKLNRRDWRAFERGSQTANTINLDSQIKGGE